MILLRRTLHLVIAGLGTYWRTAALLAAAAAAALLALLPVAALSTAGSAFLPRLIPFPTPLVDLGIAWSNSAQGPADLQAHGIVTLYQLLLGVAGALVVVALLTILAIAAARAQQRRGEVSIHRSVGASRWQLLVSHGAEGTVVALMGAGLGAVLGRATAALAVRHWPGQVGPGSSMPGIGSAAVIAGAVILGALFPLAYARARTPAPAVGGEPLGLAIPTIQLGLSLTAVVAAALLWRGAGRSAVAGPSLADLTVIRLSTSTDTAPAERSATFARILKRVGSAPGVHVAAITSPGVISGAGESDVVLAHCGDGCSIGGLPAPYQPARAMHYAVSPDSFRAIGLPVIAGRGIADTDTWNAPRVAVIDRSFAQAHFERGDPLGHDVRLGAGPWSRVTVVGVVADRPVDGIGGGTAPANAIYLSVLQQPPPDVELLIGGGSLASDTATAQLTLGPRVETMGRTSVSAVRAADGAPVRWFAALFGAVGCALLVIATGGTATVVHRWIDSLALELGLRRAVGASRGKVITFVLVRVAGVAVVGTVVGIWLGIGVWGTLHQAIPQVPEWDAQTIIDAAGLLVAAALAGGLVPTLRAARAAPTRLLDPA
ncbi:MAG: FtsX-like permease family protein [Gemmatimonadales bacterium]